jgi:tRNA1Val (adenine37-N6)-methyltransferase
VGVMLDSSRRTKYAHLQVSTGTAATCDNAQQLCVTGQQAMAGRAFVGWHHDRATHRHGPLERSHDRMTTDDITLDILAGSWRIFQLRRGHRFSTDDLLTAWAAVRAKPEARQLLDLGAGIGSVGLLALWRLPAEAHLTMVEVQAVSHALAGRTVAYNGLIERVMLHLLDLRRWPGGTFDLVTASPPYLALAGGVHPQHAQKVAARFELHGSIYDYCSAAARSLAHTGVFCFCHAADDPRPEQAIARAGLRLVRRQPVYFRATLPPRIALFTCGWKGVRDDASPLVIRDQEGRWTAEYLSMREEMGAAAAFLQRARGTP